MIQVTEETWGKITKVIKAIAKHTRMFPDDALPVGVHWSVSEVEEAIQTEPVRVATTSRDS